MRTKQWISAVASLLLSIWSVVTFVELFLPEHPLQLALLTLPEDHYWQIGLGLAWPIVFLLIVPRWRRDHLETYSFVVALGGVVTAILHQICSNRVSLFFLDPFFLALGEIAVIGVFGWVGREVPAIRYYLWQAIIGLSLGGSLAYAITERSVALDLVQCSDGQKANSRSPHREKNLRRGTENHHELGEELTPLAWLDYLQPGFFFLDRIYSGVINTKPRKF